MIFLSVYIVNFITYPKYWGLIYLYQAGYGGIWLIVTHVFWFDQYKLSFKAMSLISGNNTLVGRQIKQIQDANKEEEFTNITN